jgi:hypothetical protein
MPKREGYEKGIGPYSKNDVKLNRQPDKGYPKPVDISRRVNPAADQDGGFSGKLPSGE